MTCELVESNNTNIGYDAWSSIEDEVPFAGDSEDGPDKEVADEISSLERLEQQMREAGYEIRKVGEATVLGKNQDGNIRIDSEYRELWYKVAQDDPEFYHDIRNHEFSIAIWDVCNAAMIEDLNLDSVEDKIPRRVWEKCTKLATIMQDPEYRQKATRILDLMSDIGAAGDMVSASIDVLQHTPADTQDSIAGIDLELQRKQEYYAKLEKLLGELRTKPSINSVEWEDLAESYDSLGDYADAQERAKNLRRTVRQLEELTDVDF